MRSVLVTIFCLIGASLFAEAIGGVEYGVPPKWKVATEIDNEQMQGIFYVPEEMKEGAIECFSVSLAHDEVGKFDVKEFEKGLQIAFPEQTVQITVLEETPEATLYEWSAGKGSFYGWGRAFSQKNVLVSYQTNQDDKEGNIRSAWIARLQKARTL